MPVCTLCSRPFKTRGTLRKHQQTIHDGKTMDDSTPPTPVSLTYYVNFSMQPLKCPLCLFDRKRCKNVNSMAAHFRLRHPHYQLCVLYHCQWCDSHIDPAEIRIHARSHSLHRCAGQPFSPPIPQINPADGSLSFIDSSGHVYDEGSIPDFPPGFVSSSPASLSLLAPPQDVAGLCGALSSATALSHSPTCDVGTSSLLSPIVPPSEGLALRGSLAHCAPSSTPPRPSPTTGLSSSPLATPSADPPASAPVVVSCSTPCDGSIIASLQGSPVRLSPSSSFTSSPEVPTDVRESIPPPVLGDGIRENTSPTSALSVSPCDSPTERRLLLGPSPSAAVVPTTVVTKAAAPPTGVSPRRGRSIARRPARVRAIVRSTDRSTLKKLHSLPRKSSRSRNSRQDLICGAVPGFGEPEVIWSNGEDVSPEARVLSPDRSPLQPRVALDPSSPVLKPSGPRPPATCPSSPPHEVNDFPRQVLLASPPTPRLLKSPGSSPGSPPTPPSQRKFHPPNPFRLFPSHLPFNDLRRRLIRGLRASSPVSAFPPKGPVVDSEKQAYLADQRVVLDNLKRVCFADSPGGDGRVVRVTAPEDRRCVLLTDDLGEPVPLLSSPLPSGVADATPPSDYSAPYPPSSTPPPQANDSRLAAGLRSPSLVPAAAVESPDSADSNRVNALRVLRATFRNVVVDPPTPPPRPPSTSSAACSTCAVTVTSTVVPRASSAVAPPVDPSKRRGIYRPTGAAPGHHSTSQALASLLRNFRPRPQSESDEDSCFDPRTPPPPSPALSTNPADEDCAVDVVNLECAQPSAAGLSHSGVCHPNAVRVVDNDTIPPAQPRRPRGADVVADPPANPDPPHTPDPDADDDLDTSEDLLIEPGELDRLNEFRSLWIERFNGDLSWDEFSVLCERFAVDTREMAQSLSQPMAPKPVGDQPTAPPPCPPPPPRRPPHGRGFRSFNPVQARRIQGLYHHSRKRAARKLLCDTAVQYSGSVGDAETYFVDVLSEKTCNTNLLCEALRADVPGAEDAENTRDLKNDVSASEVAAKLRSAANTAPGSDKVEYAHLKRIDPSAKILTPIFNRCIQAQDVPAIWKQAVTVLIYKKGDASDISNFRPIALMSCIYKLLMGIIAKRLTRWSIDAGILSPEQKCARPTEGCYEHTYILKSLVGQARRNKKKLSVAWLDIRNAFGSVPHAVILSTLRHIGVPVELTSLIMNAYTGAASIFKTPQGDTSAIPIRAGVKQGCPLSPILFNLCIELIIRRVKAAAATLKSGSCVHYGSPLSCLAYADDLVIVARNKDALQRLLDAASEAAHIVGFQFRPDKCASLTLTSTPQRATFVTVQDFTIQGHHIPALTKEEPYRYLGVPIGLVHNIDDLPTIVPALIKHIELIGASLLAPWQKIDALRTFVQPCLSYALRAGDPLMQSLDLYKATLLRTLRDICNLPTRASASYFFSHKRTGGMAFQDPRTECDVMVIAQAVRILSSSDPAVAAMARHELKYIVRRSTQSEPTPELLSVYLSSTADRRTKTLYYTYSSLWSRVRQACRRLRVSFHYSEASDVTISADDSQHIKSPQVITFLHRLVQSRCGDDLMQLKDQGKVARCLSDDQYANGSTWHCTGLNLRFKDWRFIHRARLNVVPLNAVKSRYSHVDPVCRHCLQPETLPHVICHCRPHMPQIRDRHNSIVSRLTNAIRFGKITTDRTVAESNLRLRPDVVVEEGNQVLIIDVTCPFDNDSTALSDAATGKVLKYQPLKEFFVSKGKSCVIFPFVVGALGSWYKQNEILLKKLGMTRRYKSLFRKLCCTDAIKGSNDIYRLHLGCDDRIPGVSG